MRPEPFERLTARQYALLEDFAVDGRKFGVFEKLPASATALDLIKIFVPLLVRHPERKSTQPMRNCIKAGKRNVLEQANVLNNALTDFGSHVVTFDGQRSSFCSDEHSAIITHTRIALAVKGQTIPVKRAVGVQKCKCRIQIAVQKPTTAKRPAADTDQRMHFIYTHKGIFKRPHLLDLTTDAYHF